MEYSPGSAQEKEKTGLVRKPMFLKIITHITSNIFPESLKSYLSLEIMICKYLLHFNLLKYFICFMYYKSIIEYVYHLLIFSFY